VNERQRREALGVGLVALGILVTLALVPQLLPGRSESGNLIGPAGELLNLGLNTVFGVAATLSALPAFVWASWCFGIVERKTAVRWSVLAGGAMLFVPAAWWFISRGLGGDGSGSGWLGGATAGVLTTAFGTVGAQLIVAAFVAALVVLMTLSGFYLTLRFAPLPTIGIPFLFGLAEFARFVVVLLPLVLLAVLAWAPARAAEPPSLAMARATARPSPTPCCERAASPRKNLSKIRLSSPATKPGPRSRTSTTTSPGAAEASNSIGVPGGV